MLTSCAGCSSSLDSPTSWALSSGVSVTGVFSALISLGPTTCCTDGSDVISSVSAALLATGAAKYVRRHCTNSGASPRTLWLAKSSSRDDIVAITAPSSAASNTVPLASNCSSVDSSVSDNSAKPLNPTVAEQPPKVCAACAMPARFNTAAASCNTLISARAS